jgi:copper resistance protein C
MPTIMSRTALALLATTLMVGGSVLGLAASAQAHNYVVASTPASDEVVTTLPGEFSVTTNAPLLTLGGSTDGFGLQVVDSAGTYYGDGCIQVTGATISSGATLGQPGDYTLIWQVVSEDGHPVSGEIAFSWQPEDATQESAGSSTPPDCGGTISVPAEPSSAPAPGETAVPISAPARPNANLSDVLWIGGAIVAVLGAGLVTFLVIGRRNRS